MLTPNESAAPMVRIERIALRFRVPNNFVIASPSYRDVARFPNILMTIAAENGRDQNNLPICLRRLPPGSRIAPAQTQISLAYPVTVELLDDIRVHGLGIGYIQIALGNRAAALLGQTPSIERGGQARIDSERRVEIGDGVFRQSALQVNQAAAVERVDEVGAQPERLVAILQRRLQVADHRACPTAIVEGFNVLRIQPDRVVEILDRQAVGALAGIDLSAAVQRVGVIRVGIELLGQALDGRIVG